MWDWEYHWQKCFNNCWWSPEWQICDWSLQVNIFKSYLLTRNTFGRVYMALSRSDHFDCWWKLAYNSQTVCVRPGAEHQPCTTPQSNPIQLPPTLWWQPSNFAAKKLRHTFELIWRAHVLSKQPKRGIFEKNIQNGFKMATQSCDLHFDNEKLFRATTGTNPESLIFLHTSILELQPSLVTPLGCGMWAIRRLIYSIIPCIRPPFDAQKLMPKMGGGLIHEELTFLYQSKE